MGKGVDKMELSYIFVGNVKCYSNYRKLAVSYKVKHNSYPCPVIPALAL